MKNVTDRCGFQSDQAKGSRANIAGFSLSEFTGMMAVVALLFTMAAPNFVKARKQPQANAFAKDDEPRVQTYVLKMVDDPADLADNTSDGTLAGMALPSGRAFAWVAVAPSDEPWNRDSEQIPVKGATAVGGFPSALVGAKSFGRGRESRDSIANDLRSRSDGFVSALTK